MATHVASCFAASAVSKSSQRTLRRVSVPKWWAWLTVWKLLKRLSMHASVHTSAITITRWSLKSSVLPTWILASQSHPKSTRCSFTSRLSYRPNWTCMDLATTVNSLLKRLMPSSMQLGSDTSRRAKKSMLRVSCHVSRISIVNIFKTCSCLKGFFSTEKSHFKGGKAEFKTPDEIRKFCRKWLTWHLQSASMSVLSLLFESIGIAQFRSPWAIISFSALLRLVEPPKWAEEKKRTSFITIDSFSPWIFATQTAIAPFLRLSSAEPATRNCLLPSAFSVFPSLFLSGDRTAVGNAIPTELCCRVRMGYL